MANEKTITVSMSAAKGGATLNTTGTNAAASVTADMTGVDMVSGTFAATTTTATLTPAGISGQYDLVLRNTATDPLHFLRIGSANADPITAIRTIVPAGQTRIITVESSGNVYVEADAGSPTLFYAACEA